ncbi:ABC transporter permease [Nitriliruptor alkaliphilus]|uniref:ABC transporter permease n=1 Tax=Nitriliruptor alkaliphilus TaxID=427918 RepID=UPI000696354D|nr:ABC transporter permease [Nitriliruptor alkaliphilus]
MTDIAPRPLRRRGNPTDAGWRAASTESGFGRAMRIGTNRMAGGLAPLVSIAMALLVWSAVVASGIFSPQVLPSPAQVWSAGVGLAESGLLWTDLYASGRRALSGFLVGSSLAVAFGALTARSRIANVMLEGTLQAVRPIPAIALVPLAILWFGIGEQSKLFLVSLGVFFPVWITAHTGIASTRRDYLQVAACMNASRRQTLFEVVMPAALPMIVAGLRVGIATSFILIVAAEMTGATSGLGFRLDQARLFSRADRLFVCLVFLGLLGAVVDQVFHRLTTPLTSWAKERG